MSTTDLFYGQAEDGDGSVHHAWTPTPHQKYKNRAESLCGRKQNKKPADKSDDSQLCPDCAQKLGRLMTDTPTELDLAIQTLRDHNYEVWPNGDQYDLVEFGETRVVSPDDILRIAANLTAPTSNEVIVVSRESYTEPRIEPVGAPERAQDEPSEIAPSKTFSDASPASVAENEPGEDDTESQADFAKDWPVGSIEDGATLAVQILRENLLRGLDRVNEAKMSRSTIPVLENVLIQTTDDGRVMLSKTNLEIVVQTVVSAKVSAFGAITVNAEQLTNQVRLMTGDIITLEGLEERCAVKVTATTSGTDRKQTFVLPGISADEFPSVAAPAHYLGAIQPDQLITGLEQIVFGAADDNSILSGVRFWLHDQKITLVAAMSFRGGYGDMDGTKSNLDVTVPKKSAKALANLLDKKQVCHIAGTNNQSMIMIQQGMTRWTSRILDGKYPDVVAFVNIAKPTTRVIVNVKEIESALKPAANVAANAEQLILLTFQYNGIDITTTAKDGSSYEDRISAVIEPPVQMTVKMSCKLLQDALNAVRTDKVAFVISDPNTPFLIKEVGSTSGVDLTLFVMPMGVKR